LDPSGIPLGYPIQVSAVEIQNGCEDGLKQGFDLHLLGASVLLDPLEMEWVVYERDSFESDPDSKTKRSRLPKDTTSKRPLSHSSNCEFMLR
jgi:hypothetical protein